LSGIIGVTAAQQRSGRSSSNQLVQQGNNDAATTIFRAGRDAITDAEWAKAQAKFDQLISGYPGDKNLDAALYWKAYAQNKQAPAQCSSGLQTLKAPQVFILT